MTYTLTSSGNTVIRDSDGAHIPADPDNVDYQAYQVWCRTGNTANPPPAPPPAPPPSLSFLQFMALFTPAEQEAIFSSNDVQTKIFIQMASSVGATNGIGMTNPEVAGGIEYLATPTTASPPGPGLITANRVPQILANQPPPASKIGALFKKADKALRGKKS